MRASPPSLRLHSAVQCGSLLLPGSNLTKLMPRWRHLSGGEFFRQMAPAGVAAILVTAAVVGIAHHRSLRTSVTITARGERPALGAGTIAVIAATVCVLVLRSPALPVPAVGLIVTLVNGRTKKGKARRALDTLRFASTCWPLWHRCDPGDGRAGVVLGLLSFFHTLARGLRRGWRR